MDKIETEQQEVLVTHDSDQDIQKIAKQLCIPAEHLPIYRLEAKLLTLPQVNIPVEHAFCNGIYARTVHIPAYTVLTGAVHKDESFFVVRKGYLIVTTDDGSAIQVGPGFMCVTRANTKRAGIALTDVDVTTFHANPTNETDPQAIWDMYTIPAPDNIIEIIQCQYLEDEQWLEL